MDKKRVLIMAAGTGGHIFPALTVAHALRARGVDVAWLGTPQGMENQLVSPEVFPLYRITMQGVRGKGWRRLCCAPFRVLMALGQALKILRRFQPDVVLGMGGFVSVPGGLAAKLLHKRLIIHEQNAVMGLANRFLSHLADVVLLGFPIAGRGLVVGNPIRPEVAAVTAPRQRFSQREKQPVRLLIFAGSQGARSFNRVIPAALKLLPSTIAYEVWHQAGEKYLAEAKASYREAGITAKVNPFITDMADAYAWADLVIARAGALTVSEISTVGLAAIFVPYPGHADQQQKFNAEYLVKKDAAILIDPNDFQPAFLGCVLQDLLQDRERLKAMAERGRAGSMLEATAKIVKEIMS